jgi:hypothetical protein
VSSSGDDSDVDEKTASKHIRETWETTKGEEAYVDEASLVERVFKVWHSDQYFVQTKLQVEDTEDGVLCESDANKFQRQHNFVVLKDDSWLVVGGGAGGFAVIPLLRGCKTTFVVEPRWDYRGVLLPNLTRASSKGFGGEFEVSGEVVVGEVSKFSGGKCCFSKDGANGRWNVCTDDPSVAGSFMIESVWLGTLLDDWCPEVNSVCLSIGGGEIEILKSMVGRWDGVSKLVFTYHFDATNASFNIARFKRLVDDVKQDFDDVFYEGMNDSHFIPETNYEVVVFCKLIDAKFRDKEPPKNIYLFIYFYF